MLDTPTVQLDRIIKRFRDWGSPNEDGVDKAMKGIRPAKALGVWLVGTVYVLAVLAAMAVLVWAADHRDNSADPTHWGVGALVVLAPLAIVGVLKLVGPRIRRWVGDGRGAIIFWVVLVGLGVVLVVGAQAVIADASACTNQDCVRFSVPVGIACVMAAWSLPLGLWTLRRVRYPAPLMSVGLVAVTMTLLAGLAAAVQWTMQEDDYADLAFGAVWLVWILPALLAVVAIVVLRGSFGATSDRIAAGRTAAGYLVSVGSWLMALPFVMGVDNDALPVLLAASGGPGLALLAVGLAALVPRQSEWRPMPSVAWVAAAAVVAVLIGGLVWLAAGGDEISPVGPRPVTPSATTVTSTKVGPTTTSPHRTLAASGSRVRATVITR
jgi:hypothetical protein